MAEGTADTIDSASMPANSAAAFFRAAADGPAIPLLPNVKKPPAFGTGVVSGGAGACAGAGGGVCAAPTGVEPTESEQLVETEDDGDAQTSTAGGSCTV